MVGRGEGRERKMKLGYWGGGGAIERGLCSAFLSIKCPVWNGGRRGDCGVCPAQVGFRRVFPKLSGSSLMLVPHLALCD